MENRSSWLYCAISGALAAGRAILDVYGSSDMGIEKKNDDSPLTRADRRAHEIILAAIGDLGIPVLSEEGRDIAHEERSQWQQMWIVDPLDGTKEFIKRNGEFTVNIALAENGTPTMGVIFVPVADTLYFADTQSGAYKIDSCGDLAGTMSPSGGAGALSALLERAGRLPLPRDESRPFTIMGSRSHATPELQAYVETMRQTHADLAFISAGSSLKICRVAEGRADIYPRLGPTMEWDTAAGQAIATASGAQVIRHDDGTPLRYNKENLLNPWFIVKRE
ncbi:3'(2'),5'-bisphosphate nucleotidase CysQ [Desulfosarcina ovata subsp. sediminis]|uniref:3'(2'),5'-bisphosphate nucleotidase CysQ n=1 Tax=Desulfosarcina ovata subsp. sediminis TaxID=885957 RepID=A0A5K7ZWP0_9BACT|nr:3'(2'),5'-bisphosphate nucleotidase CysQ [Desulfosarcina ovata]BBO84594.1 3'(2'),5'-bisphosphate nucleotidase CysQ [Desulfosarcina ovata subsp. sediminis]